ncbi:hypothetical protein GCM10010277_87770 [Streptomyces longisporoflavus]|uniref:hypothetical protein n=1 Tax=Streptomyces longisporoflavus TaxID=28044 RepID=UPI00167DC08D|nr:hypothetical protein [Streptomyces longisporoflavus]GGV73862.1 hypothetical protein GCM10010277_87770 [Streptomyces longisporoflavus]
MGERTAPAGPPSGAQRRRTGHPQPTPAPAAASDTLGGGGLPMEQVAAFTAVRPDRIIEHPGLLTAAD